MVDEFSVCTLKSALPNDPPGFTLGRVFSSPVCPSNWENQQTERKLPGA